MLTIKNVKPSQGINYFKQENYYSKDEAKKHSNWASKGAAKFKLQGAVEGEAFANLLNGYSPDGKQALTGKAGKKNRRAAIDCTFSAPKSLSLAALMGGKTELIEAHQRAVSRALAVIEHRYSQARVWDGERQHRVNTGNLITALFHHTTSREKDPQLHTHCVIINATQLPDGRWRALSNEEIYRHKMLLGAIYRNELAQECRKLGYEIEKRPKDLFEIKGYTEAQLQHFSKRRGQILDLVGPNATAEEKQWAALYQRPPKGKELPLEELRGWWQAQDEALNLEIQHPVPQPEQSSQTAASEQESINPDAIEAVKVAIEHCSEKTVAFKQQAIEAFVLSEIKSFSYSDLEKAIAANPELIQTYDERFTTQKALDRELATIRLMLQGQGEAGAIAHPEVVEGRIQAELERLAQEGKRLTQGQQEAVRLAATTQDQFSAWCGVAGSGKTYSLKLLRTIAQDQGYTVRGFAPSGNATRVLGEEMGMETQTVAMLLKSKKPQQTEQAQTRQLWIVDEAGLLNAKDGYKLLKRAREEGARIVLTGDYRQNSAVEAGSPFRSLLSAGISVAQMNESLRQKTPELKHAADLAASGHHAQALSHLNATGRIEPLEGIEARTEAIAQEYLRLTPQERSQTLILAGTHKEKAALMSQIREGLRAEGTLSLEEVPLVRLKAKDLTSVQTRYTHNYCEGEMVVPVRECKRLGLHKFTPYCVEAIQDDKLLLSDPAGNLRLVDPMKFRKQVYTPEKLGISVGDRLRWTKGNGELGRINGEEFTVTTLDGYTATIEYDNGDTASLYLAQPLHLDYALVSTTYSSQGKTADHALISSTVDATVSQESIYVAISRTRHDLKIFAEDLEFLMEHAQESSVQRNPLELLVQTQPKTQVQAPVTETVTETPSHPAQRSPEPETIQQAPRPETPKPKRRETQPKPPTPKPQKLQPFWTPESAPPAPSHLEEKHWQELVIGSAIHPALAQANAESVAGQAVYERLLSTKLEQIGSGQYVTQPGAKLMKAYEDVAEGGWWAKAGIDARSLPHLQPGEQPERKLWGSFKPDHPRIDADKSQRKGETEFIKYEHPLAEERQLFLFEVPDELAQQIYDKHNIQPTEAERQSGFWSVVWKYNLPISLTEGAKKTLASLSQGEITIGLSGVNGGYFAKDKEGNRLPQRHLHPELAVFATPGRAFRFAFDHDTKPSTVANVRREMVRTGELLELEGCTVQTIKWQGDKGLDDLIANQGPLAYAKAHAYPAPLAWEAEKHYRGEYTRLSRQVRKAQPRLQGERLDAEVYKLAAARGDIRDGARAIAQSDQARALQKGLPPEQAQQQVEQYIQHIEHLINQPTTEKPNHERNTQQSRQSVQPAPQQATPADSGAARPAESEIQLPDFSPPAPTGAHQQPGDPDRGAEPARQPDPPHPAAGVERLARAIDERAERRSLLRCCGSFDEAVERFDTALGQAQQLTARLERVHRQLEHQARRAEPNEQRQSTPITEDLVAAIAEVVESSTLQSEPALLQALQGLSERLTELPSPEAAQSTPAAIPPQVFLGSLPTPEQLTPTRNYGPAYKPAGGLWTSAYHPEQGSEWLRFVRAEGLYSETELQQMQLWRVQPKPDVKVLVVDSPEVLQSLPHLPPRIPDDDVHPLDYEAISQEYDAMLVKREAIAEAVEVYSFDIESTIWFGTRGWPFESVEPLAMPQQTFPSSLTQQETTHEQTQQTTPRAQQQRGSGDQPSTRDPSSLGARDEQSARAADHGELLADVSRGTDATPGADRAPGAETGAVSAGADSSLAATARELSEGLDATVELQEVQRLAEAISQLNRDLEQHLRPHRQTGSLRRAVEQLYRETTAHPGQPEAGDLLRNLAEALEQQTLEDAPELDQAIAALSQRLENLPQNLQASERLAAIVESLEGMPSVETEALVEALEQLSLEDDPQLTTAVQAVAAKLEQVNPADREEAVTQLSAVLDTVNQELEAHQIRQQLVDSLAGAIAEDGEQLTLNLDPSLAESLEQLNQRLDQPESPRNREEVAHSIQTLINQLRQSDLQALADGIEVRTIQTSPELNQAIAQVTAKLNSLQSASPDAGREQLYESVTELTQQLQNQQRRQILEGLAGAIAEQREQSALQANPELNHALSEVAAKLEHLNAATRQNRSEALLNVVNDAAQELAAHLRQSLLQKLAEGIEQATVENQPGLASALEQLNVRLEELGQSGTQEAVEGLTHELSTSTQQLAAELRQARLEALADAIEGLAVQGSAELPEALQQLMNALEPLRSSQSREAVERLTTTVSDTNQELSMNIPGLDYSLIDGEWQRGLPDKWEINRDGPKTKAIERSRPPSLTSTPPTKQAKPPAQAVEPAPATLPEAPPPFQLADYTAADQWSVAKQRLLKECLLPEVFVDALHQKGIIEADPQGQPVFTRYAMNENLERGEVVGAHLDSTSVGEGHFWVQFGQGEARRVLITSSPLDALSLAALERREVPTLYLAVDPSGRIPTAQVQRLLEQQAQVTVAVNRAEEPLARQLLERLPGATRRAPDQGYSWNEQLQQRRYQALYEHYSDNGKTSDIAGIMRRALQDGRSTKEISMILAQHPSLEVVGAQRVQDELQTVLEKQQAPPLQPAQLSPQQLWQQYSQRAKAANPVSISLEVAQMALRDQVPNAQIRQILQANPHLQQFGEKGRREMVEQPLAKAKQLEALARNPQKEQSRQEQRKGLDLQN